MLLQMASFHPFYGWIIFQCIYVCMYVCIYMYIYTYFCIWTWVWISSGSWWWTGKPDMLQSMGSQRVGHDWATELNWTVVCMYVSVCMYIYICVCLYIFFIHSSFNGNLDCFHVLAIVKQHCSEYWGACILSNHVFLQIYAQEWDHRIIW